MTERKPMLRDEYGHRVEFGPDGVHCPVPEHNPERVVDLHTAREVWSREQELVADGGTVIACPECDRSQTQRRTTAPGGRSTDGEWYCEDCQIYFDEPTERAPRGYQPVHGLAAKLDAMDPGDLVTDGGDNDE
jgi:ribosomal protein L37AE/L43A